MEADDDVTHISLLAVCEAFANAPQVRHSSGTPVLYMIENPETGQYYFGATTRGSIRRYEHTAELKEGTHHNHKLQQAYNENSKFEWREVPVETRGLAFNVEKALIEVCRGDDNCLNLRDSVPFGEERSQRISEAQKRHHASLSDGERSHHHEHLVRISQERWRTISPEEKERVLMPMHTANRACPKSDEHRSNLSKAHSGKILSQNHVENSRIGHFKPVMADGVRYESSLEAARAFGISSGSVCNRLNSEGFPGWYRLSKEDSNAI